MQKGQHSRKGFMCVSLVFLFVFCFCFFGLFCFCHQTTLLGTWRISWILSLSSAPPLGKKNRPEFLGFEPCGLSSAYTVPWLAGGRIQPASHSQVAMSVSKFLCQICGNFAHQLGNCGSIRAESFITAFI